MPRTYEGCIEAREISLTRKGANQHAHVLIRKSVEGAPSETSLENNDMATAEEIQKAAAPIAMAMVAKTLGMNEVTKAHFLALPDDQKEGFLAKSDSEMAEIAKAAKEETDRKAAEAEAAKSGKTANEAELQKSLDSANARIAELEKSDRERREDAEIEKRAGSEFAGYPGGTAKAVGMLKSAAKLDEAGRKEIEDLMKSQIEMAKRAGTSFGLGGIDDANDGGAQAAAGRIKKAAEDLAKSANISYGDAYEKITEKAEFAEDVKLAAAA